MFTRAAIVLMLFVLPLSALAQNCAVNGTNDCNSNGVADSCDVANGAPDCNQNAKPDSCDLGGLGIVINRDGVTIGQVNDCNGDGVPNECEPDCDGDGTPDACEADADHDNVADSCETFATCGGACIAGAPGFDEDHDGIPNCTETSDLTDPCDSGSYVPRLRSIACGLPNGFFNQINIATVINHLDQPLDARVDYRDLTGALKGTVSFTLNPKAKRDVIMNDMGLERDTYGTVCVSTSASNLLGAWSGGLAVYKRREVANSGFSSTETFDYALYYPFTNPAAGVRNLPVNTNSIGTDGLGTVANWIRISDPRPGDGIKVTGVLNYYNAAGALVGSDRVDIPDGGRFDFGAHVPLGLNQVGLAQFVPDKTSVEYYIETTRYFYEGTGAASSRFYTAFPIPVRALTGATLTGNAQAAANEVSIVEIVNGRDIATDANVAIYSNSGSTMQQQVVTIPPKGSYHKILTSEFQSSAGSLGSAQVTGPNSSLITTSLLYGFDQNGRLLYASAPPFVHSAGAEQFTEFNSFIGHQNTLETINSTASPIKAAVTIINFDDTPITSFELDIPAKGMDRRVLTLPADNYGTIVFDSGSGIGLVVRNDVSRPGQYVMPFLGR